MQEIEKIIDETVAASQLGGEEKESLEKELVSHFEKTDVLAANNFGDPKKIGRQVQAAHEPWGKLKVFLFVLIAWVGTFGSVHLYNQISSGTCAGLRLDQCLEGSIPVLFFGSLLNFVALLSPFSWGYLIVSGVFGWCYYTILTRLTSFPARLKKLYALGVMSLAAIGQWWSLFMSYQQLPLPKNIHDINFDITSIPFASGGFPFKVFEYPFGAGGSDMPPISAWPTFFLNYLIWVLIAASVWLLLPRKIKENKKLVSVIGVYSFLITFYGLMYVMLQFD